MTDMWVTICWVASGLYTSDMTWSWSHVTCYIGPETPHTSDLTRDVLAETLDGDTS